MGTFQLTNHVFGAPHQFTSVVDPRITNISDKMGANFCKYILNDAPICTIIPGEPDYLPSVDGDDQSMAASMAFADVIAGTISSGDVSGIIDKGRSYRNQEVRLYDFKAAYGEYMDYVNVLCRAGAILLGIGNVEYCGERLATLSWRNIDMAAGKAGSSNSFSSWLDNYMSHLYNNFTDYFDGIRAGLGLDDIQQQGTNDKDASHFVQFYIDPDTPFNENMQNSTADSAIKSAFESGQNFIKEFSFLANSGGLGNISDNLSEFANSTGQALSTGIAELSSNNGTLGQVGTCLSRLINLSSNIIRGENLIMPQIWQSSSYSKSYDITIHLKSPYGNKLAYYLNVFVPLMHLIALALPRQSKDDGSNNTYASPFLVKATVDGEFYCNLGIVDSISINRAGDSWTCDGVPCEIDVNLNITDLYSQLVLSKKPRLFRCNASLIEFLAVNTGLSVVKPNLALKMQLKVGISVAGVLDGIKNPSAAIQEILDEQLMSWSRLT